MRLNSFARGIFQASVLDFLPTDKDGGFLIMTKDQKLEAFRSIRNMRAKDGALIYAPTTAFEERFLLVPRVYRIIAKEIEEAEECEGLASVLCNSLGTEKIASHLKLLAKTHKAKLGYRPIHACIGYAYEPLSRWCSHKMQQTLTGCDYILRDSHDSFH